MAAGGRQWAGGECERNDRTVQAGTGDVKRTACTCSGRLTGREVTA